MSIEVTLLISIIALASSIYFGLKGSKRNDTKDIEARAANNATVNIKLDAINGTVNDIKYDVSATKKEVADIKERLIIVEQSVKSAHHRIDGIKEEGVESHA